MHMQDEMESILICHYSRYGVNVHSSKRVRVYFFEQDELMDKTMSLIMQSTRYICVCGNLKITL